MQLIALPALQTCWW